MNSNHILLICFLTIWILTVTNGSSPCFSDAGKINFCQPDFINIVQDVTAHASSTCGQQDNTENICRNWYLPSGYDIQNCIKCDERISNLSRNVSFVLDRHIRDKETFWMSGLIPQSGNTYVINITINLKKLYEVYYITIEFSGQIPDSMILYKSSDYGKSWSPWNYFSTSCQKSFNMRRSNPLHIIRQKKLNKIEPACFSFTKSTQNITNNYKVVPFNPMIGRNSLSFDIGHVKEWVSLTDFRISMFVDVSKKRKKPPPKHLAITDITIGGRGQCFGHAETLVRKNNTLVCDCKHGTTGPDCSKCLNTHNDQPWKLLYNSGSNEPFCERCHCNNHAEECEFDKKIYEESTKKHGSRCLRCQHHTSGPYCDTCSPGYYRNRAFPVNHLQVCQECSCHSIGSVPQSHCNQTNGNCQCKNGVEGKSCNRCKKGYHQTKSEITPCVPDDKEKMVSTDERCGTCGKNRPRIKFRKFCKKHLMIKVSIQSKEIHGDWTRFGVRVYKIWRIQQSLRSQVNLHESDFSMYPIWVENADIRCNCPGFKLGHTYLLLTKVKQKLYLNQPELIVDRKSIALEWRDNWTRRLNKFKERETQGKCNRFQYRKRHSSLQTL